jgi:hypothetical protein
LWREQPALVNAAGLKKEEDAAVEVGSQILELPKSQTAFPLHDATEGGVGDPGCRSDLIEGRAPLGAAPLDAFRVDRLYSIHARARFPYQPHKAKAD